MLRRSKPESVPGCLTIFLQPKKDDECKCSQKGQKCTYRKNQHNLKNRKVLHFKVTEVDEIIRFCVCWSTCSVNLAATSQTVNKP